MIRLPVTRRRIAFCLAAAVGASAAAWSVPTATGAAAESVASTSVSTKYAAKWCVKPIHYPARFSSAAVVDVNNRGVVVGSVSGDAGGAAAMWRHGRFRLLPAAFSGVTAVNDHNVILGYGTGGNLVWRVGHGRPQVLGDGSGIAYDINNRGEVVGQTDGPTVWRHGVPHALPVNGEGGYGWVYGIDDSGFMVGADDVWAYGWRNDTIELLQFPDNDFDYGLAYKVNNGVAVGQGDDGGTYAVPLIWDHSTKGKRLWFPQDVEDAAWANDVNNHRLAVGTWNDDSREKWLAVAWIDGRFRVLPSGGADAAAVAVSDTGLIVGWRGEYEAVLWRRC